MKRDPTRQGYKFEGWSPSSQIAKGSTGDKTFTANWKPIVYAIKYNLGTGAENNPRNPDNYTIETNTVALTDPTRQGYKFEGWSPSSQIAKGSTGDKTFTANWSVIAYKIEYKLNGGINSNINPSKYTINDAITLLDPERVGYYFTGWSPNSQITKGSTDDKSFEAKWKANTYKIKYNANGGSGVMPSTDVVIFADPTTDLSKNTFVRTGYHFIGWALSSTATHFDYFDEDNLSDYVALHGATISLYAVWGANEYVIKYELNVGQDGDYKIPPTHYIYDSQGITLPEVASRKGYNFMGWSITPGGKVEHVNKDRIDNRMITRDGVPSDITLYARWSEKTYTLVLSHYPPGEKIVQSDFEISVLTKKVTFGSQYDLPVPVRAGYTFEGWYLNSDYSEKLTFGYKDCINDPALIGRGESSWFHDVSGTHTVYAKWDVVIYKIDLNSNEASILFAISESVLEVEVHAKSRQFIGFGYAFKSVKLDGMMLSNRSGTKTSEFTNILQGTYVDRNDLCGRSVDRNGVLEIDATVETYGIIVSFGNQLSYGSDNGVLILDFSNAEADLKGFCFTINSSINQITFYYNKDKNGGEQRNFINFRIEIANRLESLILGLDNFRFSAPENSVALQSDSDYNLTIAYNGVCSITGGKGSDGVKGGDMMQKRNTPAASSKANNGNTGVFVKGIDGSDGEKGTNGYVGIAGYSGTDGKPGMPALKIVRSTSNLFQPSIGSSLSVIGGAGGAGGQGGKGGQGGTGGTGQEGGDGGYSDNVFRWADTGNPGSGGKGGDGGQGGQGGRGGNGGNAGSAIVYSTGAAPTVFEGVEVESGKSGIGGIGGIGGDGGLGGLGGYHGRKWDNYVFVLVKKGDSYRAENGDDGIEGSRGAYGTEGKKSNAIIKI